MTTHQRSSRADAVVRVAAGLAFLVGAGLIGGVGWMVWYGQRQGMLFGYIFFGLLPFILGVWVVLGAHRLWRGNPNGAALAKTALWLPLTLFVGGVASTPFVADPDEKVPFLLFFGAVSLVLLGLVWLLGLAEKRLLVRNAGPRRLVDNATERPL
jgi:hypothetical protein